MNRQPALGGSEGLPHPRPAPGGRATRPQSGDVYDPAMEFEVDDKPGRLDLDWIWHQLSVHAYWHTWRQRKDVEAQVRGAWRVVGAYDVASGRQIGFARAMSDGVNEAYLGDVIVDESARGQGVGKRLVRAMIDDGPGARFRWTLFTRDAHGLYEQFGFTAPDTTAMVRPGTRHLDVLEGDLEGG